MTAFISFEKPFRKLLKMIVECPQKHAKWLNTLSFLENSGARKIAECEHPTLVKEEMLKHAAEEFRHAHHLKRQIKKIFLDPIETYSLHNLLGGPFTLHYLPSLDLKASRYLKSFGLSKPTIKEMAYLLVTYAIELRAEELYPIYDEILRQTGSPVNVRSILLEEKEHLHEMKEGLNKIFSGLLHAEKICSMESHLCKTWLHAIEQMI